MLYYILFNTDLTPEEAVIHFLITVAVFMISLSIHEFAHAFAAHKMGDNTAKLAGRMTLNPFKHLNLSGFVFFMMLGVGWAKPVPINPMNFKKYKKGTKLVSISGVFANFSLGLVSAILCAILFATVGMKYAAMEYVYTILLYIMLVNSFLALFNILPIPPLDGFNFVASFSKGENKFIKFMLRNGSRILISILLISLLTDVLFGIDLLSAYLSLLYNWVFLPITALGI